ncbi:hypothetical protein [Sphingobium bisphenolivorans]|uniref:hypothetical protein n=1 Tax=Sphingobium bisphenolivorans TaxID=1335760 RepID=UPI00126A161A|nr:hypothetical protein [Sphingobium bisphenolivorans]
MAPIIMIVAAASSIQPGRETCLQTHIFADGHVETSTVREVGQGASASSLSSGERASSHVYASSSSGGHSAASSSASTSTEADGNRRSVQVTNGPEGCRIMIDERPERKE